MQKVWYDNSLRLSAHLINLETCRNCYLCLNLSMHVNKIPFHLVTQAHKEMIISVCRG
jgi:hypothetical protein